jgi:surface antigen
LRRRSIRRLAIRLSLTALAASLVVALPLGGQPASATLGSNDYPTSIAGCVPAGGGSPTTCDLKTSAQDSWVDPWGFYNRECTSFVAWRLNNDNQLAFSNGMGGGHFGNAYEWKDNAVSLGYSYTTATNSAVRGSVAWWAASYHGASSSGHVAYVDQVNADGSIDFEDYNAAMTGVHATHHYATNSPYWPSGFIHFKDLGQAQSGGVFKPYAADFNNDGYADIGLRNANDGTFFTKLGTNFGFQSSYPCAAGSNYQPFAGEFNNDGYADIGMRDSSNGYFFMRYGPSFGTQISYQWAAGTNYAPFVADFNNDGYADIGLRDSSNGVFYIKLGTNFGAQSSYQWAAGSNYQPFAADFNNDGYGDIGMRDSSTGWFYIKLGTNFGAQISYQWAAG